MHEAQGIKTADVLYAWKSTLATAQRLEESSSWIVIDINSKVWPMEMVAIVKSDLKEGSSGEGLIHHAMTRTSDNSISELRTVRRAEINGYFCVDSQLLNTMAYRNLEQELKCSISLTQVLKI